MKTRMSLAALGTAVLALSALSVAGVAKAAGPSGSAERGRAYMARCTVCHDTATGANRVGPSLRGVVGRRRAGAAGYAYSPALQKLTGVWTPALLDAFLAAPTTQAPGTRMFTAISDSADRADLIAHLTTLR